MKNNTLIVVAIVLCAIIFGILGYYCGSKPQKVVETDTVFTTKIDTLWRDTTITIKELVPKEIVKKKVDTLYLSNGDTLNLITESKRYDELLTSGVDTCSLEIYTTGIHTSMDSIKWKLQTHKEIVTNTIEITKFVTKKRSKWDNLKVGVQIGYGLGFKSKSFEPYIGLGISYNLEF